MADPRSPSADPHVMQCSEVWGGNDEVSRGVAMPGLDAWVLSRPHAGQAAGGDIHYVSSCATGRITRILVADVAGHGSNVAGLAGRLRTVLRRFVNTVDQTRLAGIINREFAALADEGRFATAVVATFWGPTGEIDVTNAGHPPPMLFRAAARTWEPLTRAVSEGEASDIPLGMLDDTTYSRTRLRLRRGDLLLLYTDAAIEARDPGGTFLGQEGLLRVLRAEDVRSAETLVERLFERVREFTGGGGPDDDTTLLLMRLNEVRVPRGGLTMGLAGSARLAREFVGSLLPGGRAFAWPEMGIRTAMGAWFDRFNRLGAESGKNAKP